MKIEFSAHAIKDYEALPIKLKQATDKQFAFLLKSLLYPSLRAKKHNESGGIWQARITKSRRFYFKIVEDTYCIVRIVKHPK